MGGAGSVSKGNRVEATNALLMPIAASGYVRLDEDDDRSLRTFRTARLTLAALFSPLLFIAIVLAFLATFQPLKGSYVLGAVGFLWGLIAVVGAAGACLVVVWGEGRAGAD